MRDEKRRVYQLNLGKSSQVTKDLPVESLYFNKCNIISDSSLGKIRDLYFINNNLKKPNPSYNPALPISPTNRKYFLTSKSGNVYPNVMLLGDQKNNKLINKNCVSNSKTLGNSKSYVVPIFYPGNRYFINCFYEYNVKTIKG